MPITITLHDDDLAAAIKKSAPPGVSIAERRRMVRTADYDQIIIFTLTFIRDGAANVFLGLVAAWLYDLSKKQGCEINKGADKIPESEVSVRRWIQEDLDIGHND